MEKDKKNIKKNNFSIFLSKKNIKQDEIAKKIGLTQQGISEIANGKRKIREFHALAIQAAYDVSAEWLLTGKGEMMLERAETSKPPPATASPPLENTDKIDQILRAVESGRDDLRRVGDDVIDIRSGQRNIENRIGTMDSRLVGVEERVAALEKLDFGLTETGLSPKRMEMAKKRQSS